MTSTSRNGTGRVPRIEVEEPPPHEEPAEKAERVIKRWHIILGGIAFALTLVGGGIRWGITRASEESVRQVAAVAAGNTSAIKGLSAADEQHKADDAKVMDYLIKISDQIGELRGELRGRRRHGTQP